MRGFSVRIPRRLSGFDHVDDLRHPTWGRRDAAGTTPNHEWQPMKRFLKIYLDKPELAGLALLIVLVLVFQAKSNGILLSFENMRGVMGLLPEMALVAIGVTLLMICGEFDLSVGSVFALMPMSMAVILNSGVPFTVAVLLGLMICGAIGSSWLCDAAILDTELHHDAGDALHRALADHRHIRRFPAASAARPADLAFHGLYLAGLAVPHVLPLVRGHCRTRGGAAVTHQFRQLDPGDRRLQRGRRLDGHPVKRVKIVCFMLCSVLAGFAGLLQVLRLGSPLPSIGEGLELQAVAAAVIGGTALAGGIGTVFGAIIGTLLIRTIDNGLVLSRVDANWFKFAIGVLTMFAVIANAWMGKMSRKIKVEAHK